jgi:ubiquitin C-terminal hydrolase
MKRFRNIRNCCYVNATLQALLSLEEICLDIEFRLPDIPEPMPTLFANFVKLMAKRNSDVVENVEKTHWLVVVVIVVSCRRTYVVKFESGVGGQG